MSQLNISLRNFYRDKLYSVINIIGLSLGVACYLVISLYLNMELTYDRYNENRDRIYRLAETYSNSVLNDSVSTGGALGPLLEREFGEVVSSVSFREYSYDASEFLFRYEDSEYYESELMYASNSVFDVFTFNVLEGDPRTALMEPGTIAISSSMAQRYFGESIALNKILQTDTFDLRVTLVFQDLPQNTHLHYDALVSVATRNSIEPRELESIGGNQYYTYLLMEEGYDPNEFVEISDQLISQYGDRLGFADSLSLFLEPLTSIRLQSTIPQGGRPQGNSFVVIAFTFTALLVLLIAGINYVNLATARSIKRAREVGVRKVLGAQRSELITQFLGESFLYTGIAFVAGLGIAELALSMPSLQQIVGYDLSLLSLVQGDQIWLLGIITTFLLLSIVGGLYPAIYLANSLPVESLKNGKHSSVAGVTLRQFLVMVQFAISIAVLAVTQLMYSQLEFVNSYSLGFSKDNVVLIPLRGADAAENAQRVLNEVVSNPGFVSGSIIDTGSVPGSRMSEGWPTGAVGNNQEYEILDRLYVDSNYLSLLDINLVSGRDFSDDIPTDYTSAVIINETAVREIGLIDPIGSAIWLGGPRNPARTVIGVVEDFHTLGLQNATAPTLITLVSSDYTNLSDIDKAGVQRTMMIRVAPAAIAPALEYLESRWPDIDRTHPFEYQFLDVNLSEQYLSESRQMQLVTIFSMVCIFLSCLGLLGLTSLTTQHRTKEIGIRKVLGATIQNILVLLFRSTFFLILIASVIASIVAYSAVDRWLDSFYYQVAINPLVFVYSSTLVLLVAFLTMAGLSYKTARSNPIQALRYE